MSYEAPAWKKSFYGSKAWQRTRDAYRRKAGGLCERCLSRGLYKPGEIVHHKIHLTEQTVSDPSIALSEDNLELLCRECHAEAHKAEYAKSRRIRRWTVEEGGAVLPHEAGKCAHGTTDAMELNFTGREKSEINGK